MGYLGLLPSEHSSGNSKQRGGLTKTGNTHVRRILVEAAWNYRLPARIGGSLKPRLEGQPQSIIEIAWESAASALSQIPPTAGTWSSEQDVCGHRPRTIRLHLGHRNATAANLSTLATPSPFTDIRRRYCRTGIFHLIGNAAPGTTRAILEIFLWARNCVISVIKSEAAP
jgi:hypothetical protein